MSKFDINIEEIQKVETKGLTYSSLVLKFSGKNVNEVLINTLRRIMLNNIPTYAFAPECISIGTNTSVYNNDQMRIHLMQLPVIKTPLKLNYLPEDYWLGVNYNSKERTKHEQEKSIEIYISATNKDENIKNITTNDIQYLEEGKQVKKYNKEFPVLLIKLRPMETFDCKMKAVLGTGERNAIWSASGNSYFRIQDESIELTTESQGQFDEYELLFKACGFMQEKLVDLKKMIYDKYITETSKDEPLKNVDLTLDNESHTIGGILTYVLQDRDDVEFAGTTKLNELVKQITISVKYKKPMPKPLEPIMQSIDYITELMTFIKNKIYKLGKKYIASEK